MCKIYVFTQTFKHTITLITLIALQGTTKELLPQVKLDKKLNLSSETPFFENLSIQLDLFAMVDLVVTYCPYKDQFLGVGVGVNYKWVPISYFLAGLKF